MMFMVSGRATNANGSPIVRDGLVAAIHEAGHSIVTAQPRRGSYAYVDYLVATPESINRRVTKVRWASERGIRVINYNQMWRLIRDNVTPEPVHIPPVRSPTMSEVHDREAEERAARQSLADIAEQAIEMRRAELQQQEAADMQAMENAGTYNPETGQTRERPVRPKQKVVTPVIRKPRRKIVTGR